MNKPFAPACERNQAPICELLAECLPGPDVVDLIEIGSGTGQHAVYCATRLPQLRWQTSDVAGNLPGIRQWIAEAGLDDGRLPEPLELDVSRQPWPLPAAAADAAFSANTAHIMSWFEVEHMFTGLAASLSSDGLFCLYGPFSYHGRHTSAGNVRFDAELRATGKGGIRDLGELSALAGRCGFELADDRAMPANNRTLIWRRR